MRIKVIIPNASREFRDSQIEERKKAAAPGTEVDVVCLSHGPVSIESAYDEALAAPHIIDEVKKPNLKMLVDTFHMNIEEPDMVESILGAKEYISHVHFADSNRWAPGCGHIDFRKILEALKQIGYRGAISAEILPKPTPEECVKLTIQYYKQLGL